MSRILVTGGTGFIGRALATELRRRAHEVIPLASSHGDIADPVSLEPFAASHVDHVFHLAGRSFVPDSWSDAAGFLRTNIGGTVNVLDLCRRTGAGLTFASGYLYGVPERLPINEDAPVRPNNPYALSKHLSEQVCEFYVAHFGVKVSILRIFNVFGVGQDPRFLIPKILTQLRQGGAVEVLDLKPRRDYVYLDDVIAALAATLSYPCRYNVFNIGSGCSHSVLGVIKAAQIAMGRRGPVVSKDEERSCEIPDVIADIRRARQELGWTPQFDLSQGIRAIVASEGK